MANYSELIATINEQIKANGNQEITGPVLNSVLQAMVSALGEGYSEFRGKSFNPKITQWQGRKIVWLRTFVWQRCSPGN